MSTVIRSPSLGRNIVSLNVVHHIALTYDGLTIRLFLDGDLEVKTTAGGAVTQGTFEEVSIGPEVYVWPNGPAVLNSPAGFIDSIRISDIARYNKDAGFGFPRGKFASDSDTLALLNFDNIQGPWVVGNSGAGDIWFPVINADDLQLTGVVLRDLVLSRSAGVSGDGLFGFSTIDSQFINITSSQGNWDGMEFTGSCYRDHFVDFLLYGTYCDFCGGGNSGLNQFDGGEVNGGVVLMGLYGWAAVIHTLYGALESSNQFGLVYTSAGGVGGGLFATGFACDAELHPPNLVSCFDYAGSPNDVMVLTASALNGIDSNPSMRVNGGGSITLIEPSFWNSPLTPGVTPDPPAMIHVVSPPSKPITVVNPVIVPPTVSLVDNNAPVDQIGPGVTNSCADTGDTGRQYGNCLEYMHHRQSSRNLHGQLCGSGHRLHGIQRNPLRHWDGQRQILMGAVLIRLRVVPITHNGGCLHYTFDESPTSCASSYNLPMNIVRRVGAALGLAKCR